MTLDELDRLTAQKAEYEKRARENGREAIAAGMTALLRMMPKVMSIEWTQYTPYFNDGEPCEFGVNEFYLRTVKDGPEVSHYDCMYLHSAMGDERWSDERLEVGLTDEDAARVGPIVRSLNEAEDVFLFAFGDHAKVIAKPVRDGDTVTGVDFEVEEYDHD